MNDETAPQTYQEDDTPTKPVGKPTGGWVMPEPVFRKSSGGTLPRRLGLGPDGRPAEPAAETGEQPSKASMPNGSAKSAAAAPVADQPDMSSDFSLPEDTAAPPAVKNRSGTAKLLLIVLGLAGILLVIGIFLVVIYFLFFTRIAESQTF